MSDTTPPLLDVTDLCVRFRTDSGVVRAVDGLSFSVRPGETVALVGESGSGKSVTSLAILRLLPSAEITGRVLLRGRDGTALDLLALAEPEMRKVRGDRVAIVFQEPMSSLNPVQTIGAQIAEAIMWHRGHDQTAALTQAQRLLEHVGIPDPKRRLHSYPHQLSGGMRQRAMIAMALACDPELLIADEPTTALDVTVQAQILDLLQSIQRETGMAVLFITHNLGVVAEIADRVMVMYAGRMVEQAGTLDLFRAPLMPYTAGLLGAVPRMGTFKRRGGGLVAIPGNVPDPTRLPPGCAFAPRCAHARRDPCLRAVPALEPAGADRLVRCARWREIGDAA